MTNSQSKPTQHHELPPPAPGPPPTIPATGSKGLPPQLPAHLPLPLSLPSQVQASVTLNLDDLLLPACLSSWPLQFHTFFPNVQPTCHRDSDVSLSKTGQPLTCFCTEQPHAPLPWVQDHAAVSYSKFRCLQGPRGESEQPPFLIYLSSDTPPSSPPPLG